MDARFKPLGAQMDAQAITATRRGNAVHILFSGGGHAQAGLCIKLPPLPCEVKRCGGDDRSLAYMFRDMVWIEICPDAGYLAAGGVLTLYISKDDAAQLIHILDGTHPLRDGETFELTRAKEAL